jgi:hypothetical protein
MLFTCLLYLDNRFLLTVHAVLDVGKWEFVGPSDSTAPSLG